MILYILWWQRMCYIIHLVIASVILCHISFDGNWYISYILRWQLIFISNILWYIIFNLWWQMAYYIIYFMMWNDTLYDISYDGKMHIISCIVWWQVLYYIIYPMIGKYYIILHILLWQVTFHITYPIMTSHMLYISCDGKCFIILFILWWQVTCYLISRLLNIDEISIVKARDIEMTCQVVIICSYLYIS